MHSCGAIRLGVRKSLIEHKRTGMRFSARVQFRKNMVIGNYSRTLMYGNLYVDKDLDRRYREGFISVSLKEFQRYAVHISNLVKENAGRSHHAWIFPVQLNPMHFLT